MSVRTSLQHLGQGTRGRASVFPTYGMEEDEEAMAATGLEASEKRGSMEWDVYTARDNNKKK